MKKNKKLFGSNIEPSCDYCVYSFITDNTIICHKSKKMLNNKCKKFLYNPIKRIPRQKTLSMPQFEPKDFIL